MLSLLLIKKSENFNEQIQRPDTKMPLNWGFSPIGDPHVFLENLALKYALLCSYL